MKNRQSGGSKETTAIKLEFKVVPKGGKENVQREAWNPRSSRKGWDAGTWGKRETVQRVWHGETEEEKLQPQELYSTGTEDSRTMSVAGEESSERQALGTKELYSTQKDHLHFSCVRKSIRQSSLKAVEKQSEVFKSQMTALNHREKQWGMEVQNTAHEATVSVEWKQRSSSISILLVLGQVN